MDVVADAQFRWGRCVMTRVRVIILSLFDGPCRVVVWSCGLVRSDFCRIGVRQTTLSVSIPLNLFRHAEGRNMS